MKKKNKGGRPRKPPTKVIGFRVPASKYGYLKRALELHLQNLLGK